MRFTFASPLHQLVSSVFRQLHPPELFNLIFFNYIFVHNFQPAVQFVRQPCFNSTQNSSTASPTQVHGSHPMSDLHSDLRPIFHFFSSKTHSHPASMIHSVEIISAEDVKMCTTDPTSASTCLFLHLFTLLYSISIIKVTINEIISTLA